MISKKLREIDFEPKVLMSQISQILTDAILEGLLKGGDQLIESELQKDFGISRSPLREAFRDLEKKVWLRLSLGRVPSLRELFAKTSKSIFQYAQPSKAWRPGRGTRK